MRILIVLSACILAGCAKEPATLEAAALAASCSVTEVSKDGNVFKAESAKCSDGGRVFFYPTEEASKGHSTVCKTYGGKVQQSGKTWTKYLPSC